MSGSPPAEVNINEALVRALLSEQHPDLAHLRCVPVDAGWDNVVMRLGESLCLRLPRRTVAVRLIENEQAWLPMLAPRLPFAVPEPVRKGMPGCGYPWPWSIVRWLSGISADLSPPSESEATRFGEFLKALHVPAPVDAPTNLTRGVPLSHITVRINERMLRMRANAPHVATAEVERIWEVALAAPIDVEPTWIHGDLHPRNIVVDQGVISGVIDWGDVAAGDRATDLASLWMLFETELARSRALSESGSVTDATYLRAKGWAVGFGVTLLDTGLVDSPQHAAIGERTLRRVLAGP